MLEAVHLILAVPLFVVVVAVDPRWLLQSLRLHYSELLAAGTRVADHRSRAEAAGLPRETTEVANTTGADVWESSPVRYLEKIIQIPFALRPISAEGVNSLVEALLPVAREEQPPDETAPVASSASDASVPRPPAEGSARLASRREAADERRTCRRTCGIAPWP